MNMLSAIILGIVQGLTEFLPVSSSGHLVIAKQLLSFQESGILFEVILHAGTTLAILYFFKDKLLKIKTREIGLILLGTIPAVVVGFLFKDTIEGLFTNVKLVGVALLVTGTINIVTDKRSGESHDVNAKKSLLVGLSQAFAIIPGISRSGSTIFASRSLGISAEKAAEFSFLLSIPAIVGANVLEIVSNGVHITDPVYYIAGFLAAFISGIFAIRLVMNLLSEKKFKFFGVYCVVVGLFTLFLLHPLL